MPILEKMLFKTFAPRLPGIHFLALQEIGIDAASLAQHAEVAAEQRVHVQIVTMIQCRNVERGSHDQHEQRFKRQATAGGVAAPKLRTIKRDTTQMQWKRRFCSVSTKMNAEGILTKSRVYYSPTNRSSEKRSSDEDPE